MGHDDEYLEPKQRLKSKTNLNKYMIEYNDIKREISAHSYQELVDNTRIKYELEESNFKIEAFFESYQDWIVIDSLPDNQSKLRISVDRYNQSINNFSKCLTKKGRFY